MARHAETAQDSIIDRLRHFNAKERFWAITQALGTSRANDGFVSTAAKAAGVEPPSLRDRASVFLAMDYHLNWLYAALTAHEPGMRGPAGQRFENRRIVGRINQGLLERDTDESGILERDRALVENSQEDVDLLLAYPRKDGKTQLLLIEAKCIGSFTAAQLESKASRLCGILSDADILRDRIDAKVVLLSPSNTQTKEAIGKALDDLRSFCRELGNADLIPASGLGWMNLETKGEPFWCVEFRTASPASEAASTKGKRRFWTHWALTSRRSGSNGTTEGRK